jgi:hypothetical protein
VVILLCNGGVLTLSQKNATSLEFYAGNISKAVWRVALKSARENDGNKAKEQSQRLLAFFELEKVYAFNLLYCRLFLHLDFC